MPRRWIIIALLLSLAVGCGYWLRLRWAIEHRYDKVIAATAARYGVEPSLIKAVVWKESRFTPDAIGRKGEIGLMQLMDLAAQEWAETEKVYPLPPAHLLDVRTNLLAGTWYIRKLLLRYRNTDRPAAFALADYNAGRGNVLKWARGEAATNSAAFVAQIGFPSTRDYVDAVLNRMEHYRGDFRRSGNP